MKRLNFLWGVVLFGAFASALFVITNLNQRGDLSRAEIVRYLKSSSFDLEYPQNDQLLVISRPSDKLIYQWSKISHEKLDAKEIEYLVRVISPTGEMLIDEVVSETSISLRNLFSEGEYQWQVTPIYGGIYGNEVKATFSVGHPDLKFQGDIDTPIDLLGTIQPNGDVLFEDGSDFHDIVWFSQKESPDEKYLIEISKGENFHSLHQRTFSKQSNYQWREYENGQYFFRVTRVDPFGELKGVSNTVEINVVTQYPLPKIVKTIQSQKRTLKKIARKKYRKKYKKKVARAKKKEAKREPASIESRFEWKWSYLIPKDVMISLGTGQIQFSQTSETTDANTSFTLQNIGIDARFQESNQFYVDAEGMLRTSTVKNAGDFVDSYISLVAGKEWQLDFLDMKVLASGGAKYSNVNYFEQDFETNIDSKQDHIFSATAQAGIVVPVGESITNKLRVIVDVGALNQYGVKYNGRYSFANNKWFVDLSGGYFDGTYSLTDEFNEKTVERSEVQLFMGIGHSFK